MKKILLFIFFLFMMNIILFSSQQSSYAWGFFAHEKINRLAVFTLPPAMMVLYKKQIDFVTNHAPDADKRKFIVPAEAARHFIDIDHYGIYPYTNLPHDWKTAVSRYSEDTLNRYGIVPWYVMQEFYRLTDAFKNKNQAAILKLSADLGHYIADAHVPLHACTNYNGQLSGQEGIHALWESNIPEMLADSTFDYFVGSPSYLLHPQKYIWQIILQSAAEADTVLQVEKKLSKEFPPAQKYAFVNRKGKMIKTYSLAYVRAYNLRLHNMVERRMHASIHDVASFWYTAWVNAGQPDLSFLSAPLYTPQDSLEWQMMNKKWINENHSGRMDE